MSLLSMSLFPSFSGNSRGSVSQVFAIALLPLLGSVGVAVDYSRATQSKAQLQSAVDSTALMLAKEASRKSESQLQAMGTAYFSALVHGSADLSIGALAVRKTNKSVTLSVEGVVKTQFAGLFGWPEFRLGVDAVSAYGTRKIEVALVLDNTGSMASSNKIGELKKASHTLISLLEAAAVNAEQIRVAVVPYTTRVNLGTSYKNEMWLTNQPTGSFMGGYHRPATRDAWQGCVADRDAPYNRGTASVSTSVAQSLYPMVNCTDGVAQAQPLTSNWSLLRSRINAMQASGMTDITLGAQWGFEMLSGAAPFSESNAGSDVERFMILLTDGDNTQDRWGTGNQARMDGDTRAMCDAIVERGVADSAKKHRIKLYTVLVINGNENLLRNCASNPSMFKKVNQASELEAVFRKIADDIGTIRLTM